MAAAIFGNIGCVWAGEVRVGMIQSSPGYVYFITADNGLTKIGCTASVERRLNQLKINSPSKLVLALSFETDDAPGLEKTIHNSFSDKRIRGEWFELTPYDLIDFVDQINKAKQELVDEHVV